MVRARNEVDDFTPIQITRKLSVEADTAGRFAHRFGLNTGPSSGWKTALLQDVIGYRGAANGELFDLRIEDDVMVLTCIPDDLVARYAYLKAAVVRVNSAHVVARRGFDDLTL